MLAGTSQKGRAEKGAPLPPPGSCFLPTSASHRESPALTLRATVKSTERLKACHKYKALSVSQQSLQGSSLYLFAEFRLRATTLLWTCVFIAIALGPQTQRQIQTPDCQALRLISRPPTHFPWQLPFQENIYGKAPAPRVKKKKTQRWN